MSKKLYMLLLVLLLSVGSISVPTLAHGAEGDCAGDACDLTYQPLEPLKGIDGNLVDESGSKGTLGPLLNSLFGILLTVGGFFAVGTLIWGGIMYMTAEAVGKKTRAKERIWAALWGLVILIASYLILYTINPELLSFNLLSPSEPAAEDTTDTDTSNPYCSSGYCNLSDNMREAQYEHLLQLSAGNIGTHGLQLLAGRDIIIPKELTLFYKKSLEDSSETQSRINNLAAQCANKKIVVVDDKVFGIPFSDVVASWGYDFATALATFGAVYTVDSDIPPSRFGLSDEYVVVVCEYKN